MNETNHLLTVTEFAAALRVKPSCVRRWIHEEKVTIVHVGRLVRIPANEVGRIISAGTRPATGARSSAK
jgi:excisionase family DNA binding protein